MTKSILPTRRERPEVTTQVVAVTPALAEKWLGEKAPNRNVSWTRIEQYKRDMVAGKWRVTNQGIAFDEDGRMIDGEHRCHAVVLAERPIEMLVVTGLPRETQAHIDTGRSRTAADAMAILDGTKHAKEIASISKLAISWDHGLKWLTQYGATHQEIRDYASRPENYLLENAAEIARKGKRYVTMRPAVLGFCYYICARKNVPDADSFFADQLIENIGLASGDPAHTLNRRLVSDAEKQGARADFNKIAYTITAWNRFRANKPISKLQAPSSGWTTENYPEPK